MSDIVSSNADPELFAVPRPQLAAIEYSTGIPAGLDDPAAPLNRRALVSRDLRQPVITFLELTISQAIGDPLIALLNEADGVNEKSFAQLLQSAARVL